MAQNELLELNGTVDRIIYRNEKNQYTVLELTAGDDLVTVVGSFPLVGEGEELRIFGGWEVHASYGEQFKAAAFERAQPATEEGILKYLASGTVKGVGKVLAMRIVDTFGAATLEVMENDPQRLAQVKGITPAKAQEIGEEFQRLIGLRDLMAFLGPYGVFPEQAILAWRALGQESLCSIKRDPYLLCGPKIGVRFGRADAIAQAMERPADDASRVEAGVIYVLRHNLANGHTCLPEDKLGAAAARMMGLGQPLVEEAINSLCGRWALVREEFDGRPFIFLREQYDCETYIAGRLKAMLRSPANTLYGADVQIGLAEEELGIQYEQRQRDAIRAAMEQGVLILTGGPGTGKTTTLNAIIHILKMAGEQVLLAAPTGRAAKRMTELTGEEAKTIHRMLQVDWDELDNPIFIRNESNPLECECVVIDEMSMVDSYVFESVLRALPLGCRLILVGDSDQLPSVGAGNVLGDLIAAGIFPTVQLREVFRQSMKSLIVASAHRIVEGMEPELTRRDSDFFFLPRRSGAEAQELIVDLCGARLPKSYGYDRLSDIQVLCPGRRGELGTWELNQALQAAINPPGQGKTEVKVNGQVLRVGDKVMQVRNDYRMPWARDDGTEGQGVFNGDMGVIVDIDKPGNAMRVRIDDRTVLYDLEHAGLALELAYAVTIHKSQGNEFTAVVIPALSVPRQLKFRNLLYTGVTRAKRLLVLVGSRSVINSMIENNRKALRYTGLKRFLERKREPLGSGDLEE